MLVSGLIVPASIPGQVLRAIRDRRIELVVSWELAAEVGDVLRRPKIRAYGVTERDVADVLALFAPFLPGVELVGPLRDPEDRPVVLAAVAGEAEVIVTGDRDLLEDVDLRARLADHGIKVLTPREALAARSTR